LNIGNTGSDVHKVEGFRKRIRENDNQRSALQIMVILFENGRGDNNNNNNKNNHNIIRHMMPFSPREIFVPSHYTGP
jgi:hypothetical protein